MDSVNSLFFEAVLAAASPINVAMPNVGFDPKSLESYYQVLVVPGKKFAFDIRSTNKQGGFVQVSCYVKEKVGEIKAITMAEQIIAVFPRNTKMKGDDFVVNLVQPAYYSQGLNTNNGWYMVPVTIPYTTNNF